MSITSAQLDALKFPVGVFNFPENLDKVNPNWIETIKHLPTQVEKEIEGLSAERLAWRYRPDGWTILEVIHHLVDSHLNAFMRVKRALTEDNPTISPYNQSACVELPDATIETLSASLTILKGLHQKWQILLSGLTENQWQRTFHHPEWNKDFNLIEATSLYDWHCRTHLAHIKQALESQGKYND